MQKLSFAGTFPDGFPKRMLLTTIRKGTEAYTLGAVKLEPSNFAFGRIVGLRHASLDEALAPVTKGGLGAASTDLKQVMQNGGHEYPQNSTKAIREVREHLEGRGYDFSKVLVITFEMD